MTGFLASVTSVAEAALVVEHADIIDLKNPAQGALGALPVDVVEDIVRFVDGRKPVSATVGDLPMLPDRLVSAVTSMSGTGVDIVKVGFFGATHHVECARAMAEVASYTKIVAVMFADQSPDVGFLQALADAGFYGAMLDTADKKAGGLCHWLPEASLRRFVAEAGNLGLLTGLAGSLRLPDIPQLAALGADYLGFRGALCQGNARQSGINQKQVVEVNDLLCKRNKSAVLEAV